MLIVTQHFTNQHSICKNLGGCLKLQSILKTCMGSIENENQDPFLVIQLSKIFTHACIDCTRSYSSRAHQGNGHLSSPDTILNMKMLNLQDLKQFCNFS